MKSMYALDKLIFSVYKSCNIHNTRQVLFHLLYLIDKIHYVNKYFIE